MRVVRWLAGRVIHLLDQVVQVEESEVAEVATRYQFRERETTEPRANVPGWDIVMEVQLSLLASLYAGHGWLIQREENGKLVQPSHYDLAALVADMVETVDGENDGSGNTFFTSSRLLAATNEDYPGDVDLFLYVGTATRFDGADPDMVA